LALFGKVVLELVHHDGWWARGEEAGAGYDVLVERVWDSVIEITSVSSLSRPLISSLLDYFVILQSVGLHLVHHLVITSSKFLLSFTVFQGCALEPFAI
jgi:hypothetical protein